MYPASDPPDAGSSQGIGGGIAVYGPENLADMDKPGNGSNANTRSPGQEKTQLLVPNSRREMVFQGAHFNPMASHLGNGKTLERIMARFYWPGICTDGVRPARSASW
ncbi:uncharacterized protein AB9W97_015465 isoform 1-T1 [Spinachia spinachia]